MGLAIVLAAEAETSVAVVGSMVGSLLLGIAAFLLADRLQPRFVGAIALLAALSAGFGLFVVAVPSGNQWLGLVVFFGFFGFVRLLSRFESIRN